jgi:hypothetical protein
LEEDFDFSVKLFTIKHFLKRMIFSSSSKTLSPRYLKRRKNLRAKNPKIKIKIIKVISRTDILFLSE